MLVALAIAIPALVLMYRQGAMAITATRSAASYEEAIARARSHLEALVDTALIPGERSGDDGGVYRWRTRIAPLAVATPPGQPKRGSPYAGGTALFAVSVQIAWPGLAGERTVTLETRRLGPVP